MFFYCKITCLQSTAIHFAIVSYVKHWFSLWPLYGICFFSNISYLIYDFRTVLRHHEQADRLNFEKRILRPLRSFQFHYSTPSCFWTLYMGQIALNRLQTRNNMKVVLDQGYYSLVKLKPNEKHFCLLK